MSKLISSARGYFRKKKAERKAERETVEKSNLEPTTILKTKIKMISKRVAKLKIQLHEASLAYLQIVQERLREKVGHKRQRNRPVADRRKLGTLALRLKSTATRAFNRVKIGKVLTFPGANGRSPIKDPNS